MQPKENNTKISFKNQNQTPKEFGQRTRPDPSQSNSTRIPLGYKMYSFGHVWVQHVCVLVWVNFKFGFTSTPYGSNLSSAVTRPDPTHSARLIDHG